MAIAPTARSTSNAADAFQWTTGDRLCSPAAPCVDPATGAETDESDVTGLQGNTPLPTDELMPAAALEPYPVPGPATPAVTPRRAYMIDANGILDRNDATKVGDIALFRQCAAGPGIYIPGYIPPPGEPCPYDLAIRKTGPQICEEGGECTFTVTVTNNGPLPYTGSLFLQDASDVETVLLGASPPWTCHMIEGAINCFHPMLTLLPGESVPLELRVRLPHEIDGEEWTNCIHIVWPLWETGNDYIVTIWVEEALFFMGYLPEAEVDGVFNLATEDAIRHYQHDHGLPETGVIDEALRAHLFPHGMGLIGDCDPRNDRDCHTVHIPRRPLDLRLDKTGPAFCEEGGECIYRITVTNAGPETYAGVISVTDTVPAGADYLHATDPWTCHQPGGPGHDVICTSNVAVTLNHGDSVSFDLFLHLPEAIEGHTVTDRACINWHDMPVDGDANPPNDCDQVITPLAPPQIDLAVAEDVPARMHAGRPLRLRHPHPQQRAGRLRNPVDDHRLRSPRCGPVSDRAPPTWTCEQPGGAGGDVICTLPAGITIAHGATYPLVIGLTMPDEIPGDTITDRACIDWGAMPADGDTNPGNDCDSVTKFRSSRQYANSICRWRSRGRPNACAANCACTRSPSPTMVPAISRRRWRSPTLFPMVRFWTPGHMKRPGIASSRAAPAAMSLAPLTHRSPPKCLAGTGIWLRLPAEIASETITDRACIDWGAMPADGDTNAGNDCADRGHRHHARSQSGTGSSHREDGTCRLRDRRRVRLHDHRHQ